MVCYFFGFRLALNSWQSFCLSLSSSGFTGFLPIKHTVLYFSKQYLSLCILFLWWYKFFIRRKWALSRLPPSPGSLSVALVALNLLCRPGRPRTWRSTCFFLWSTGIKGVCHHTCSSQDFDLLLHFFRNIIYRFCLFYLVSKNVLIISNNWEKCNFSLKNVYIILLLIVVRHT